jgi:hypothetical protein
LSPPILTQLATRSSPQTGSWSASEQNRHAVAVSWLQPKNGAKDQCSEYRFEPLEMANRILEEIDRL